VTVTLPKRARETAALALRVRRALPRGQQAGTRVGVARALRIARGEPVDESAVFSYLSRAEPGAKTARARGLTARSSKAIQAFELWGGAPALSYLRRRRRGQ